MYNTDLSQKIQKGAGYVEVLEVGEAFLKRDFLEPVTSYVNDQTNVVRIYQQCNKEKYAIYIEGIGTKKEKKSPATIQFKKPLGSEF